MSTSLSGSSPLVGHFLCGHCYFFYKNTRFRKYFTNPVKNKQCHLKEFAMYSHSHVVYAISCGCRTVCIIKTSRPLKTEYKSNISHKRIGAPLEDFVSFCTNLIVHLHVALVWLPFSSLIQSLSCYCGFLWC